MSLRVVKLKFIYNMNRILDVIVCYYEFKIYENVFLFFERIVMQIYLKYFIICIGLIVSILLICLILKYFEYDEVEYLRVWWVIFVIILNVLLIIVIYCGLY